MLNSNYFFSQFVKVINCDPINAIFAYICIRKFNLFVISIFFLGYYELPKRDNNFSVKAELFHYL